MEKNYNIQVSKNINDNEWHFVFESDGWNSIEEATSWFYSKYSVPQYGYEIREAYTNDILKKEGMNKKRYGQTA